MVRRLALVARGFSTPSAMTSQFNFLASVRITVDYILPGAIGTMLEISERSILRTS